MKKKGKSSKWIKSKSNKPKKSDRKNRRKDDTPLVFHKGYRKEVKSIDIVPRKDIARKYFQEGNTMYYASNESQHPRTTSKWASLGNQSINVTISPFSNSRNFQAIKSKISPPN